MQFNKSNFDDIDINYSHNKRETFLRFISNYKLCTGKPADKLMFQKLLFCEFVNSFYTANYDENKMGKIEGNVLREKPKLYVTMHLGPYKLIGSYLLTQGINLCIPVTSKVYKDLYTSFMEDTKNIREINNARLELVNIEEKSGILKLIRYVRLGYSLLLYMDGNSGIGGMERTDNKLINYHFFRQDIMVRKGVDFLANILKIPIVPIVAFLSSKNLDNYIPNITILDEIIACNRKDEIQIIKMVWDIFKIYIEKYAEQWEGWCYVDAFFSNKNMTTLDREEIAANHMLKFNKQRYDFLEKNGFYLYDMYDNKLFKISKMLYLFLCKLVEKKIELSMNDFCSIITNRSLAKDIITNQILI